MSSSNFFTVGGTVQAGGGSYIPRSADTELLDLCLKGNFAYVLTPRQMGKSSLMVRTAEQLEEAGTRSVIIDLTQIGVDVTTEQWYGGILTVIDERLELDTDVFSWWEAHSSLGVTQRLTKFFEEVVLVEIDGSVVIFIDEIDTTLGIPFTDDFFAAIRFVHNARAATPVFSKLSFVLIGVATPSELIDDPKRTPFNIGNRVDLTDFTLEEAKAFANGLNLPAELADSVLVWVMKWTNGHPYLTQRLCRAIAQVGRSRWEEADVDTLVADTFFGARAEQDNNLQFVRDMLTKRADDKAAILETYRRVLRAKRGVPDETSSSVKSHLKLSGVVRKRGNVLSLRNEIYRTVFSDNWIGQNWPDRWYIRYAPVIYRAGVGAIVLLAITASGFAFLALQDREAAEYSAQLALDAQQRAETQTAVFQERVTVLLATESRLNSDISQAQLQLQERESLSESLTEANNVLQAQLANNPDNDQTIALLQEGNRQNVARYLTEIAALESQLEQRNELISLLQRGSSTSSASFAGAPEMVDIPVGSFSMGSSSIISEQPIHQVSINHPFALSKYEVTFEQYDIYALATGQPLSDDSGWGRGTRPVINVSWNDIQGYIDWLNGQTAGGYRLPTEAEWEYAARAGTGTAYSWGEDIGIDRANCRGCNKESIGQTALAGRYAANAFGLYDMHGNVREWVQDCYVDSYAGARNNGSSLESGECEYNTLRGGAWDDPPQYLRSASRYGNEPAGRFNINGFRLALDLEQSVENIPFGDVPGMSFSWPPMQPTSQARIDDLFDELFEPGMRFSEVVEILWNALTFAGYDQIGFYLIPAEFGSSGFVMVTRVEAYDTDGVPLKPPDRFVNLDLPARNTDSDIFPFFNNLFFTRPEYYRYFAFVVGDLSIAIETEQLQEVVVLEGHSALDPDIANMNITDRDRIWVLVYEYFRDTYGDPEISDNPRIPPAIHLENSGLEEGFLMQIEEEN